MDEGYSGRGAKTRVTLLSGERRPPLRSLSPLACPLGNFPHWLKRPINPQSSPFSWHRKCDKSRSTRILPLSLNRFSRVRSLPLLARPLPPSLKSLPFLVHKHQRSWVDCAVWAPLEITVQGFDLKAATLEKMLGFVPKQISLPDWMDYLFSAPISVSNV